MKHAPVRVGRYTNTTPGLELYTPRFSLDRRFGSADDWGFIGAGGYPGRVPDCPSRKIVLETVNKQQLLRFHFKSSKSERTSQCIFSLYLWF